MRFTYFALAALLAVAGCATITTGQNQPLSVATPGCQAATCELRNDKGSWFVSSTPGTVTVQRAYGDMTVTCEKGEFKSNPLVVASATKGMAFGNILVGGLIGAAVDAGTGAAYDYPALINVPMICVGDPKSVIQPSTAPPPAPVVASSSSSPPAGGTSVSSSTQGSTVQPPPSGTLPSLPTSPPTTTTGVANTSPAHAAVVVNDRPPLAKTAALPPTGSKHMFAAERWAKDAGCQQPVATLNVQTPTFESFTIACGNADPITVRCDGSVCRELK